MLLTTNPTNVFLTMCNKFIYKPSPNLFNVNNNHQKFLNIFLSICEILISHSQLFPKKITTYST